MNLLPDVIVHVHDSEGKMDFHHTSTSQGIYSNNGFEIHNWYTLTKYLLRSPPSKTPTVSLSRCLSYKADITEHDAVEIRTAFLQMNSCPVMSNYLHQQFEEISKKSIKVMFRDRNTKNSDIFAREDIFSKKKKKMGNACHICECWCVF